jgi:hypothetical protein
MPPTSQTFVTFAYGSNMLINRITDKKRCPSARALGTAELRGYELKWHKRSQDGSGKCDVVQTDDVNSVVYGVLYQIPASEKLALNKAEGLGHGYEAKEVEVVSKGASHKAFVYYATETDSSLKPYTWYKELVVAGAREHALPGIYLDRLVATDATEDSDRNRHTRNSQLSTKHQGGHQR